MAIGNDTRLEPTEIHGVGGGGSDSVLAEGQRPIDSAKCNDSMIGGPIGHDRRERA